MSDRILLVEDDVSIAGLIRDYLEIEGFSVEHAADGKSGLDLAVKGLFNLIIFLMSSSVFILI